MAEKQGTFPVRLVKTVVMVGMMGAGKTAVGRAVAAKLGVAFCDSDHEIEAAANMSIAEIFARDGEAFFRRKESQVIERLLRATPGVLSTGGGAFLSEANRDLIAREGVSVWLDADLDLLWNRVRHKATRPLLQTSDPLGTLRGLYEARTPVYAKAAVRVKAEPGLSIDAMAHKVIEALKDHGGVLEKAA
ncbi:shikimate kinase [Thalassococcus sp. CAU 1522]|uniref:Shikimate kinase n=1 Tax=Thalassococcus arenae TaxID=2851652 RepID=A0ABS6NA07_9RHOB|nr:shikimate kinase [Thalassococcus arenae]MBV2360829.1 shikimate kinase [Thalassococcus arenae]